MQNKNARVGLVCDINKLPFHIGDEEFAPITSSEIADLIARHTWQFYEKDSICGISPLAPVYCFMIGIDEDGNKCLHRFRRNTRGQNYSVEWFRGSWVFPLTWKGEVDIQSLFNAVSRCDTCSGHWVGGSSIDEIQFILQQYIDSMKGLILHRSIDVDELFMVGSFTNGYRDQYLRTIYDMGLVILMMMPIFKSTNDIIIPPRYTRIDPIGKRSFIPETELSLLDEVESIEDDSCPIMLPVFRAIMDMENPYF